jgi:N-acetyl-gamma-glutamyl-phosphate reductase
MMRGMPPSARLRVTVAGATGYIGMHCAALLARHPGVEVTRLVGRSHAGERHADVVPGSELALRIDDDLDADTGDVVFAALPHTVAAQHAAGWLARAATVFDLSADFRLRDPAAYRRWYGEDHPAPQLCDEAAYGLVEFGREQLRQANLVAVPGCYPTAALLATIPALAAGLVEPRLVVDAKSGVSGAGRSPSAGTQFAEVNESVHAYAVEGHRHKPEMAQELRRAAGTEVSFTFVPHLVPMTRGILATAYLQPRPGVGVAALRDAYQAAYESSPFVRMVAAPPPTKSVSGSNRAALHLAMQDGTAVVTVAIDNLLKGAAGQAVQAMNVRFGFAEECGLERVPLWP